MYDKLKLWVDRDVIGDSMPQISSYLDGCKTVYDNTTGETRVYGSLDGLKVTTNIGGVSIIGSLAKFYHNNNILPLDCASTELAMEMLSDRLHIDVNSAKISSLEFGTHFSMIEPVPRYIDLLGESPRLRRLRCTDNTLYYRSKGKNEYKVHTFYDKRAEVLKQGGVMPIDIDDENLLRFELRFNRQLNQQLNVSDLRGATLYDEAFYQAMVARYCNTYSSINKKRDLKTNIMDKIGTVTDAYEVLVAHLLNNANQDEITAFIEDLKRSKTFADPKSYSRLKAKIKSVASKVDLTETNDLIKELDTKIKEVQDRV
ncbi:MAG: hypothetical protein SNH99_01855 [Rikenellaceae bacterium]